MSVGITSKNLKELSTSPSPEECAGQKPVKDCATGKQHRRNPYYAATRLGIDPTPWKAVVGPRLTPIVLDDDGNQVCECAKGAHGFAHALLISKLPEICEALSEALDKNCSTCPHRKRQGSDYLCKKPDGPRCETEYWRSILKEALSEDIELPMSDIGPYFRFLSM